MGDSEAVGCTIERMLNVNKTLKVLNLSSCELDTAVATSIFRSLQHNTSLEELDLSENSQLAEGDSEAVGCAIERTLNVNRTLRILILHGCGITDPIAKHISTGLINSTSLVILDIESPTLSISCAMSLLHQVITHPTVRTTVDEVNILGVGRVKMDKETMLCENSLGPVFSLSLDTLQCQWMKIDGHNAIDIFRSLEHNTSLEGLDLSEMRQLAEGDSEAVGCAIERMLNVNRTLKILNFTDCRLKNEVVSSFANGLAQNHSVRKVILPSNNIGSTGAVSIFRSLEHNTSLKELDLSENWRLAVGDSEAVGCTIERMLNVNKTLKVLNLSSCELDTAVATSIFRSLQHNTSLEELDLSVNSQLTEGDSEAVGCAIERTLNVNRTLRILILHGCGITDPIAKHISTGLINSTSLVILDIESPTLSISCAMSLLHQVITHPTVRTTVDEVNILGVGRVKMDKETMLCENSLGPVFSLSLDTLQCQWMKIDGHNAIDIFRSLEHNTSLEGLDLSEMRQLAEGDSEAVGCAIERMLNVNRTLKILNVTDCRLKNEVVSSFANGLAQNHSVRKVILHSNNIGSTGAVSIFRSLEHNTSLEELDLSGNSQLAEGDSEAVGCAIERMLNVNKTLKLLNLSACNVTDPIVKHIVTGLMNNISLVTLDMSSSKLSGSCAVSLFQQMTTHPTLRRALVGEVNILGVGRVKMDRGSLWCDVGDWIPKNCVEFFRALNGSNMKGLKLNIEGLTDQTAEYFVVGLAESQSVQALKLSHSYSPWGGGGGGGEKYPHCWCSEHIQITRAQHQPGGT